jgi:hypothetical protein
LQKNETVLARYTMTEMRVYKCSCSPNSTFTEKEMKVHAQRHKNEGHQVFVEALVGYEYEF